MTLSRAYRPYTRIEHFDLDGLLNVLGRKIEELGESGESSTPYYVGAEIALSIVRYHEFIDTQEDFMRLFSRALEELEGGDDGR